MFRAVRAPSEPTHGKSLSEFGYHMNETGHIVNNETARFFNFFHTDSDYANDSRRGTFQQCLRTEIAGILLEKYDIVELFLTGGRFELVRPATAHVSILATRPGKLNYKRDVIVVVGESTQDCGIWAWRLVQREGGIQGGSLAGLAEKIARRASTDLDGARRELVEDDTADDDTPGIIVLNPGQLLYSPSLNRNMTMASWLSRQRPSAISEPYHIDKTHNFVPGHETPENHIHTVLEQLLPHLVSPKARLHIITVGDGSMPTTEVLSAEDMRRQTIRARTMGGVPASIAFVEPRHEHNGAPDSITNIFFALAGKSWVQSEEHKSTLLQMPEIPQRDMPALDFAPGTEAANLLTARPYPTNESLAKLKTEDKLASDKNITTGEDYDDKDQPSATPPAPVSCPTFSAGICDGVVETVFPAVMDDVVEHLWFHIKQGRGADAIVAKGDRPFPRDGGDH